MGRKRPALPNCLEDALELRVPRPERGTSTRRKVEEYEDFLMESAYLQGELHAERMEYLRNKVELQDRWDHMTGWEGLKRTRTVTAETQAKAQVDPDLYDKLQDTDWIIKRLTEEIDRLDKDATRVSRAFEMIRSS